MLLEEGDHVAMNNMFHDFVADGVEGDRPIIRCSIPVTFLKSGVTNAPFKAVIRCMALVQYEA